MNATEVVEIAKKVNSEVKEDAFFKACERLEKMICKYANIKDYTFINDKPLIAAGGVYDGYDDLYEAYLKREASMAVEDRSWFSSYDAIFALRWGDLCREIVRKHKPESAQSFSDWRW
jgi:hypothetical protein